MNRFHCVKCKTEFPSREAEKTHDCIESEILTPSSVVPSVMELALALKGTVSMMDEFNYRLIAHGKDEHKIIKLLDRCREAGII